MTTTTVSTAGGAMPKFDRAAVMRRAWAIFRQIYKYPLIKFSDIGRQCFAWALRKAWVESREAARVAALSPVAKVERIEARSAPIATKSANYKQPEGRPHTHSNRPDDRYFLRKA
jgi:hypothetical protein